MCRIRGGRGPVFPFITQFIKSKILSAVVASFVIPSKSGIIRFRPLIGSIIPIASSAGISESIHPLPSERDSSRFFRDSASSFNTYPNSLGGITLFLNYTNEYLKAVLAER